MKNNANNKHLGVGAKAPVEGNRSTDIKESSPKRGLFKRYGASVSIGLIGLVLSLLAFFSVGEWETRLRKLDFDRLAKARCILFRSEVAHYLHELTALKRFYDGSQFVSREEFIQFITPILGTHQDLRGFAWAPRVADTDRNAFEQVLHAEGWANYLIHDSSALGEMEIAIHRKEYYPVLYHAPQLDWAIGLDYLSMSPRRGALEQARDMNQVVVTKPTVFPGESKDRFGVIAFAPVYKKDLPITTVEERRAAIEGVVICAMRVGDILENVVWELQPGGVEIRVSDLSAPEGERFLYWHRSRLGNPEEGDSPRKVENSSRLSFITSFEVANRIWEMSCTPSSDYLASHSVWIHWVLLLGGLIFTSLLAVFTYTRQNRMVIVEELVNERTAQLRANEQQLKASNLQLTASEQQLKVTNQQLMASEQQLKATNQQLRASDQQTKAANQQLRANEQQLKALSARNEALLTSIPDIIMEVNTEKVYTWANKAGHDFFGDNVLGKEAADYFDGEQETYEAVKPLFGGDENVIYIESWQRRCDGQKRLLAWWCKVLKDVDGNVMGALSTAHDITESKRLAELESRAQRLESAGKISGQIAHDFNNLLGPLMAYPDFIREELPNNHPALPYLSNIEESAARIADINQQLLTLGRRGYYAQEVLNLNEVVLRAVREMDYQSETMICDLHLSEDLMNIKGGSAQLHRVISNLLVNAQDAMQEVGCVDVRTENYYVDDMSVAYGRVPKGEYVKITVTDTGSGISDDNLYKIFDPFYTSKTTSKKRGSGLGLSVVDSVVKDHNGYLDLNTKVGHGTSFYLYFPVTREDAREDEVELLANGTETILVIDDDEIQRDVCSRLLRKLGYEVTVAKSGEEAIEFLKENPRDLLVLDMVMPPGIDGAETYRRIVEMYPNQKAIIVSGFSETERVLEAQKLGAGAFIKKPLTRKAIAAAVRSELNRQAQT